MINNSLIEFFILEISFKFFFLFDAIFSLKKKLFLQAWFKIFNGCPSPMSREWCKKNLLIERRLIDVKNFKSDIYKGLAHSGIELHSHSVDELKDQNIREALLKFIIAGAFYPNYFQLQPVEILDAHKDSFGLNHLSSVVLRGFPLKDQLRYKQWVQDYASQFGLLKNIRFDYSKCIITYTHAYSLESRVPDAVRFAVKTR